MRAVIGLLSLVLVLGAVAILAKQQLFELRQPATSSSDAAGAVPATVTPASTPADRARAVQQEIEKAARENTKRLEELDK